MVFSLEAIMGCAGPGWADGCAVRFIERFRISHHP